MTHDDVIDSFYSYSRAALMKAVSTPTSNSSFYNTWFNTWFDEYFNKPNPYKQTLNNYDLKIKSLKSRIHNSMSKQDRKSIESQIAYYQKQRKSFLQNNAEHLL